MDRTPSPLRPRRAGLPGLRAHPAGRCTVRARRRAQTGFTLVEVLVALLLMAVMAAMGWQGMDMLARTRAHTAEATERTLRLQTLLGQWQADLQAVYNGANEHGMPGLRFGANQLRLLRRAEGGVQVVVWSLRDGLWQRWAGPVVSQRQALELSWGNAQLLTGREPEQVRLVEGVRDWQLYYFRDQTWSNAQSSDDLASTPVAPPPAGTSASTAAARPRTLLPQAVRLQIELPEGKLTRDVLLSPQFP